jgi:SRSO17 transposase
MSDSPWSSQSVFDQIQTEVAARPDLAGGVLILDESGDQRAGDRSAGAAPQYIGRLGKVALGQVGVYISYCVDSHHWIMLDADLYLPECWFDADHTDLWKRWHIPKRSFETKADIGIRLIRHARTNGVPFQVVTADGWYGRNKAFRATLDADGFVYVLDVPERTRVYRTRPEVGIPTARGKQEPPTEPRILSRERPVAVADLPALTNDLTLQPISVRHTERGMLTIQGAARRVWTVTADLEVREEWLVIHQAEDGSMRYLLSNAPPTTCVTQLVTWGCQRYFVERTIEDGKSELGMDDLQACKYRAWMHHMALTALSLWFVADTKLAWAATCPRDPTLAADLGVVTMPALSTANVRAILLAVLPLPQFTVAETRHIIITHLVGRARSTASRLRTQERERAAAAANAPPPEP